MTYDRPRYSPAEAANLLGISTARVFARISEGRIRVVKDGRATFITADEIRRYAAESQPMVERHQAVVA